MILSEQKNMTTNNDNKRFNILRDYPATEKQINMIIYLLESTGDSKTLEMIWDNIPKNSKEYPDTRCDYKRQILADALAGTPMSQASWIITCLERKRDLTKLVNTFRSLGVIPPEEKLYSK